MAKKSDNNLLHEITNAKKNAQRRKRLGAPPKVTNLIKDYSENIDRPPKGKPTGICTKCGKEFDQDFSEDRNAYSSFKTCSECRAKVAKKKEDKLLKDQQDENTIVKKLPYTPYPWQEEAEAAFQDHRFVVLACGNRTGKDRASMMIGIKYFVECLNENRAIYNPEMVPSVYWWIIAPTEKMALQNWRELKQFFPKEWVVACSDSNFIMQTIGGGVIEVRSGYDENSLVGVGLDLVVLTEAARFKDLHLAWANLEARLSSEGRGREKDRAGMKYGQGKAIINSSPLGKNDFYDLWCRGQKNSPEYSSEWWSAQYPWTANPTNAELAQKPIQTKYGVSTYEETLRRQLGEQTFRSNYLADFTAELANVFRNFEDKCVYNPFSSEYHFTKPEIDEIIRRWREPIPGAIYIGGYDPATGSSGDSPAFVIREKSTNKIVRLFDLYGKTYEQQYDFIASMCKRYNYATLHWLRTGHTAIEGQFEKRGIVEVPLDEQGSKKGQLVQTLELAVENGDIQVIYDGSPEVQTLIFQMNDYSEKNGKYSNDKVPHDDFVSAMYAAFSDYNVEEVPITYCTLMSEI